MEDHTTPDSLQIKLYVPHPRLGQPFTTEGKPVLGDAKDPQMACVRRFSLASWTPFEELLTAINRCLSSWHVQLKPDSTLLYFDDEDEWVEMNGEDDWIEALVWSTRKRSVIYIFAPHLIALNGPEEQLLQRQNLYSSVVHPQVCCDSCQTCPIFGIRFKCRTRRNFDLCYRCYVGKVGREMRAQNHIFMEIVDPYMNDLIQGVFKINGENWTVNGDARTRADASPADNSNEKWIVDKPIDA